MGLWQFLLKTDWDLGCQVNHVAVGMAGRDRHLSWIERFKSPQTLTAIHDTPSHTGCPSIGSTGGQGAGEQQGG